MTNQENPQQIMPLTVQPGERVLSFMGVTLSFKAVSADTAGQWALIEYSAPPEFKGPPPHWHKQTTEAFYVVEGNLRLQLGEQIIEAVPGAFVLVPPRVVHTFSNAAPRPAKFLVLVSPAGLEGYFGELVELIKSETSWPPADMSKVMELAARYDTYAPPVEP
jgi:mannose-6-phosphate isomerase-like protein (cupin superfamily)